MKVKFTRSQGNGSPQHDSSKIKFRLIISLLHFLFARTALASFNVGFNFRFAHRKRSRLFGLKMVWKKIDLRLSKSREKKITIRNEWTNIFGCKACLWAVERQTVSPIDSSTQVYHAFVDYLIGVSTHLVRFQAHMSFKPHVTDLISISHQTIRWICKRIATFRSLHIHICIHMKS